MKLENVDAQLQEIAEYITESGLSFSGAEFEHMPTGEDFVVTVSRKNFATNHDKLVVLLSKLIEPAGMYSQMLRNHPRMAFMANKIENDVNDTINLLKELGHEI